MAGHGTPDWGLMLNKAITFGLDDLAELAARLNSVVTYDRRGSVVLLDDFSAGRNQWYNQTQGTPWTMVGSQVHPKSGRWCCRIATGTLTADYAGLVRHIPPVPSNLIGLEDSFSMWSVGLEHSIHLDIHDGAYEYRARVGYSQPDQTLYYWSEAGAWEPLVTGLALSYANYLYHSLKVVIDTEAKEYVRVMLNDKTYLPATKGLYPVVSTDPPMLVMSLRFTNGSAGSKTGYLDNFIYTQEEPA